MQRLPFHLCQPYYKALDLDFEKNNPSQYEIVKTDDRFPFIIGGERGGKSFATAAILLPHIDLLPQVRPEKFYLPNGKLRADRPVSPDFVIFGPTYAEPRIEFGYLEDWLRQLDKIKSVSRPQDGPWRMVTKEGVQVVTWSTDNPLGIRAIDPEGAAAVECGNMDEDSVYRIRGRVSSRRGFILYNGTMENAKRWYIRWAQEGLRLNHYGVKTYSLPTWDNKSLFPGGRRDPEILSMEKLYPPDVFSVRVAAVPTPPRDRVLREITASHIKKVPLPRDETGKLACRIELAIDPGYLPSAYAVLWVASWDTPEGKFWYIFDEQYKQEMMNEDIIRIIKKHAFYKYLGVSDLTIDISAKRHSDGNEPAVEQYKRLTKLKNPYYKFWHENALIERIRTTAHQNLIAIHPNCVGLIAELGLGEEVFQDMHPWKYPSDSSGIIINDKPVDRWNHSAKALGYLLLRHLGLVERVGEKKKPMNRIRDKKQLNANVRARFRLFKRITPDDSSEKRD